MKRTPAFLLISGLCIVQACNNNKTTNRTDSSYQNTTQQDTSMSTNTDTSSSSSTMSAPVGKDVADFTTKVATGGMMEVQLGQIAQTKAMDPRVRDFGAMMVKDHSAANDELKRLAASKHIDLPNTLAADDEKKINDLNGKTGK